MLWRLALIALAGCGRIGFDVASSPSDSDVIGHDEDGDGVPDSLDVCPHLAGPQVDVDGDGVGDACDPNPTNARDRITQFWTMQPGDNPFTPSENVLSAWTQDADALRLDGNVADDFYGGTQVPLTAGDVAIAFGIDVTAIGGSAFQHQFSIGTASTGPNNFPEINERIGSYSGVFITHFDGVNYTQLATTNLATGFHSGALTFVARWQVGGTLRVDAGWPGEPYTAEVNNPAYTAADILQINVNNLQLEIRYVCVITSS